VDAPSVLCGLLAAGALPPALDAFGRWRRLGRWHPSDPERTAKIRRLLVLIPARSEGARTLELCRDFDRQAVPGLKVDVCVILDGGDPVAEARLAGVNASFLVKTPAGPSKGAVLRWAAERLLDSGRLHAADYVLVFDADMRLSEGFLASLAVPEEAEAFQLPVRPAGPPPPGAPRVEALSLAVATRVEDLARDREGLPVRLRGKAMGFTPRAFRLGPAASSATMAEDSEATLVLLAAGVRVRALPGPFAFDEPTREGAMAGPRARWLAGHMKLAFSFAGTFLSLAVRKPRHAFVLAADLYLRPRAFVLAFLALAAVAADGFLLRAAAFGFSGRIAAPLMASLLAKAALVFEVLYYGTARRILGETPDVPPVTAADMAAAAAVWLRAAGRALREPGRWHRARPAA
jgi:cellulose synthase/poly-beta-1,6-N-acetylglucosamine synthase-like glycosyltransferase